MQLRRKCITCYKFLGQHTDASSEKASSDFTGNRAEAAEWMMKPGKDLVVVICKRSSETKVTKRETLLQEKVAKKSLTSCKNMRREETHGTRCYKAALG